MSKIFRTFLLVFGVVIQIFHLFNNSSGQDIETTIKIDAHKPNVVVVSGHYLREPAKGREIELHFMSSFAGAEDLDDRVSNMHIRNAKGDELSVSEIGDSYFTDSAIYAWSYDVDLKPVQKTTASTHISWLTADGGVLMIDDLLPQADLPPLSGIKRSARISFEIPVGWKIFSTSKIVSANRFDVENIEKTAFIIGAEWRERHIAVSGTSIKLLLSDGWLFSDDEAAAFVSQVFDHYQKLFGSAPGKNFQIAIYKFSFHVPPGEWEADTRGASATIASSDMAFKSASLQRLHEQLRHEIFHFWVPNGVSLQGEYDWFYEGFALYQSLKLGVAVNRITFDDMLDTLTRAYAIDVGRTPVSLVEASQTRWKGNGDIIYARGMLVAFLSDLALLQSSKGKFSTDDLLRWFYSEFNKGKVADASAQVFRTFYWHKELRPFIDRYIDGAETLDLNALLGAAGLEAEQAGNVINFTVKQKLSGRQKKLLNKLGYNNWRKLATKQ